MARGATRKSRDVCGGVLISGSSDVFINQAPAVRRGDRIASHGLAAHRSPVIVGGSNNVFINNRPACRRGDPGNCGHRATGSTNVFIN